MLDDELFLVEVIGCGGLLIPLACLEVRDGRKWERNLLEAGGRLVPGVDDERE